MLADKKTLIYSAEALDDRYIGSDVVWLQMWIICNQLYLNVKKCELMCFCDPLTDIRPQSERLKNLNCVNYLVIHSNRNLSFNVYKKRLSKHVLAVARIRKLVSRNVLILCYRSFIEPINRYGLLICGCRISKSLHIYMVRRKMFNVIFFKRQRESVSRYSQHLLS